MDTNKIQNEAIKEKVSVKKDKAERNKKTRKKISFKVFPGKHNFKKGIFLAITNIEKEFPIKDSLDLIEGFHLNFSNQLSLSLKDKVLTLPNLTPDAALKICFSECESDKVRNEVKKMRKVLKFLTKNLK